MKGEWCYFKSYFSADFCDSIIEKSKSLNFQDANLGDQGLTENINYRKSKIAWLYSNQFPDLYDELWKLEKIANQDWFNFEIDALENVQFAEYKSEYFGEYKKHQDVFWITQSYKHRKLTAVVQLTNQNEYEGGQFQLYDCNEYPNPQEIREQGTVIFFPSFTFHSVSPVTMGNRHSLSCWFEGPKWR